MSKLKTMLASVILRLNRWIWLRRLRSTMRLTQRQLSSQWKLENLRNQQGAAILKDEPRKVAQLQRELMAVRKPLPLPETELATSALEDLQMSSSLLISMLEDRRY